MESVKVLLASPKSGRRGGIARWTGHILEYYNSICCQSIKLTLYDTAEKVPDTRPGFLFRWYRALVGYPHVILGLRNELLKHRYDILHFTSSASLGLIRDLLLIRLAHKYRVKAVVHFRFGRIPQLAELKNWEWVLLSRVIKRADKTIVIDNTSFKTLKKEGFSNVLLLPNPLTPKVQKIIDESHNISNDNNTVLFVGHCYKEKGVYELMEACKDLSFIKIKYVGSIEDEIKKDLTAMSKKYGINVCFAGEESYENIIKDMLGCGIFVLPSYTEGFPNVILEAMACGCAIVATSVGAIPEMLEKDDMGCYGLIVSPRNVKELGQSIKRLYDDKALKEECQSNVLRRVYERYAMSSVWEKMLGIWNQVLS